jgi:hypothetical protein
MVIKVINNVNEFKDLEKSWSNLYNRVSFSKSVFQSFEFNYYSWVYELNNNGNILTLAVVYTEKNLVAVYPLYIDNRKRLRFINDHHADFCDCISIEEIDTNVILEKLKAEYSINSLNLINLKVDAIILNNLKLLPDSENCIPSAKYSVLELSKGIFPDNFSEYKSKQKTEFRRILKKNKDKLHEIISCDTSSFPFEEIKLLRHKMIVLGVRNNSFLPSSQLNLIVKLYHKKKLIISVVKTKETINAISFLIKDSDQYLTWIDMYDDSRMVNIFNYISLIKLLSSYKAVNINFGRGSYAYKTSNFLPKIMNLYSLHIFISKFEELKYSIEVVIMKFLKGIYKKIK